MRDHLRERVARPLGHRHRPRDPVAEPQGGTY